MIKDYKAIGLRLVFLSQRIVKRDLASGLFFFLFLVIPAHAANWFFYPSEGKSCTLATCNGTQDYPWRFHPTSGKVGAVDPSVMQSGDTLYICGDHNHYNLDDRVVLDIPGLLISGKCPDDSQGILRSYLTLRANATGSVIQDLIMRGPGVGPTGEGQAIALVGTDQVTISRLVISGWRRGLMCARQEVCDNVVIEHSTFYSVGQGIEKFAQGGLAEDTDWTIRFNHFYDIGISYPLGDGEAIGIQGVDGLHIYGNYITNARIGINMWTHDHSYIRNVTIEGNHLVGIHSAPCSWPSRGIMRSHSNTRPEVFENIVIRYNAIYNTGAQAIRLSAADGATGNIIAYNIIGETGMECEAESIWTQGPWLQEHNLITID